MSVLQVKQSKKNKNLFSLRKAFGTQSSTTFLILKPVIRGLIQKLNNQCPILSTPSLRRGKKRGGSVTNKIFGLFLW